MSLTITKLMKKTIKMRIMGRKRIRKIRIYKSMKVRSKKKMGTLNFQKTNNRSNFERIDSNNADQGMIEVWGG